MPLYIRPFFTSSLRKACTTPGTSSRLPPSASSRVAASLQKHTERIQKARQQASKPPCRRPLKSPVVAARQNLKSLVASSSYSASSLSSSFRSVPDSLASSPFCSLAGSFSSLSLSSRTKIWTQDSRPLPRHTGSRIPLPCRSGRNIPSLPLRSCLKRTTLGSSKRVHFKTHLTTIAEIRNYEPTLDADLGQTCLPFIRYPYPDEDGYVHSNIPHLTGVTHRTFVSRIPTRLGITLGKQYQLRYDGTYFAPSRVGSRGMDGQTNLCPYCRSNASQGGWTPLFPEDLDTKDGPEYQAHWWKLAQLLHCDECEVDE